MYQSIFYSHQSRECFLRDDTEGWCEFPYSRTGYRKDPKGKLYTLTGERVSPVNRFDKDDISIYEKDVDMSLSVLLDVYRDIDNAPSFHNKLFFDIECEMGGAINLKYCQDAPSKITSVAIYDDNTQEYFVYILDHNGAMTESKNGNTTVQPHRTEGSLLMAVIDKWREIDPTIVIGWNIDNFDVPYMYNRMKRVLGETKANQLSPLGVVYFDEYDQSMPYKIAGVNVLDYMRLYKKFIPKQQPSYALDAIGKKEVGRGKIVYQGSLDTLFKTDPAKFIEYNVNDVSIIVDLDKKKKFIDLAIMVCHMAHVPYQYVYQSSKVVEGAIMTYLKRKNIVSPNRPTTMHPELKAGYNKDVSDDDKFAGAYVKDPIPGLYGWNFDLDLTSLYPSIMLQLNASLETLMFKLLGNDPFDTSWSLKQMRYKDASENVSVENPEGIVRTTTIGDLIDIIESNGLVIAPNGTCFRRDIRGQLCDVVQLWFDKRKEMKNLMKNAGNDGNKDLYEFYDRYQAVYKVFLNSIYGVMGLKSFRYGDGKDIIAEAVTISGRFIIMQSADWVNDKINSEISLLIS